MKRQVLGIEYEIPTNFDEMWALQRFLFNKAYAWGRKGRDDYARKIFDEYYKAERIFILGEE